MLFVIGVSVHLRANELCRQFFRCCQSNASASGPWNDGIRRFFTMRWCAPFKRAGAIYWLVINFLLSFSRKKKTQALIIIVLLSRSICPVLPVFVTATAPNGFDAFEFSFFFCEISRQSVELLHRKWDGTNGTGWNLLRKILHRILFTLFRVESFYGRMVYRTQFIHFIVNVGNA